MNSTRVLVIVLGCGVAAIVIALAWKREPEQIDITTDRLAIKSEVPAATSANTRAPTELSPVETDTTRDVASMPAPATKLVTPNLVVTPEDAWAKKYAGLSSAELLQRRLELNTKIGELATPELQKMYDSGQYEVLHGGAESKTNEDWNPNVVMSLQSTPAIPGGAPAEWRRAILPEYKYPELYAMRHEERWLEKHTTDVQRAEADAKASAARK